MMGGGEGEGKGNRGRGVRGYIVLYSMVLEVTQGRAKEDMEMN